MKCILFSTPAYTRPVYRALREDCGDDVDLIRVVTAPDQQKGRGQKKKAPPMKKIALSQGVDVYQPESVNNRQAIDTFRSFEPDLFLVSSFGQIFSEELLKVPEIGAINVHPSLLPKYRGPAPIAHTILNGEEETGVTFFMMDASVDHGPILKQTHTTVDPHETRGALRDRLFEQAGEAFPELLNDVQSGDVQLVEQEEDQVSYASKLSREDGWIRWKQSSQQVHDQIRAMQPWPRAFSQLSVASREHDMRIIVQETRVPDSDESIDVEKPDPEAGEIVALSAEELFVQTGSRPIAIQKLQPENKQSMAAGDFINGYQPVPGDRFFTPDGKN